MTIIASIDPNASPRRVFLHSDTVGVDFQPIDAYKEMRTLRATDESLRPYDVFMTSQGNESTGSSSSTPRRVRMENSVFIPFDTDHALDVVGEVITSTGGSGTAAFDRTPLSAGTVVDINYVPPQVEIITIIGGSGLSILQDEYLTDIHASTHSQIHVDATHLGSQKGSHDEPFSSFSNAIAYANIHGIKLIIMHSDMVLDGDLMGLEVEGRAEIAIDLGGYDVSGTILREMRVTGSSTGNGVYETCILMPFLAGLNGYYSECVLLGPMTTEAGSIVLMSRCLAGASVAPSISLGDANSQLVSRSWSGELTIGNSVEGNVVTIEATGGEITLAASCVGGTVHIRGSAFLENLGTVVPITRALNTTAAEIVSTLFAQETDPNA